jgi:hypothetical protein
MCAHSRPEVAHVLVADGGGPGGAEFIASAYDFAEQLLTSQAAFAEGMTGGDPGFPGLTQYDRHYNTTAL